MNKRHFTNKYLALIILLVAALLWPLCDVNVYFMHIGILATVSSLFAVTLSIVVLFGEVSFAHGAFIGIGAYISAILSLKLGVSVWATVFIGGIGTGIIGLLLGFFILRVKGPYFFMTTFIFNLIVLLVFEHWTGFFGGVEGLHGLPTLESIWGIPFCSITAWYYLILIFCSLSIALIGILWHSKFGKTLKLIGENDQLAASLGVNIKLYKVVAFAVSCGFVGFGGALLSAYQGFASPTSFTAQRSMFIVVCTFLGGAGTLVGPIVGSQLIAYASEATREAAMWEPAIYGTIIILVILFFPKGLISLWKPIRGLLSKLRDTH